MKLIREAKTAVVNSSSCDGFCPCVDACRDDAPCVPHANGPCSYN